MEQMVSSFHPPSSWLQRVGSCQKWHSQPSFPRGPPPRLLILFLAHLSQAQENCSYCSLFSWGYVLSPKGISCFLLFWLFLAQRDGHWPLRLHIPSWLLTKWMMCDKWLSAFMPYMFWTNFGPLEDPYGYHLGSPSPRVHWNSEKKNKDSPTSSWASIDCVSHHLYTAHSLPYHFCSWMPFILHCSSRIS